MQEEGHSLVEVIVVIALVAIGVMVVIPSVEMIRASAHQTACLQNLKQIGQASQLYAAERQTVVPWCATNEGGAYEYWWQALAPYADGDLKIFHCPSDKNFLPTEMSRTLSYGWNYNLVGHGNTDPEYHPDDFRRLIQFDRPGETLIATDGPGGLASNQEDSWGYIDGNPWHTADPKRHNGKGNALFLDGHVEAMATTNFIYNPLYQNRN